MQRSFDIVATIAIAVIVTGSPWLVQTVHAQTEAASTQFGAFAARRAALMDAIPDGILLLRSRSEIKDFRESGFHQEENFFYFTGIANATNAILAIDGVRRESWLFLSPAGNSLSELAGTSLRPASADAEATGIENIVDWSRFAEFIDARGDMRLYVAADLHGNSSSPPGMAPVSDPDVLWLHALGLRWPVADIVSAADVIRDMRSRKDSVEIRALRRAGSTSGRALMAGLRAINGGLSQRTVEAAVISACLNAGADGIAFWPWVMSGDNGVFPTPFRSFGDYRHLNREMQRGELVRLDIGCEADYYQGDVGRTAPVSGAFSRGQREAWNLLVAAYRAGLAVMKAGTAWTEVEEAAREAVRAIAADDVTAPRTELGKQAVEILLSDDRVDWHHHGIGLWASEPAEPILEAGMVIAFEPMFSLEGEGYYLEDMILITAGGYEILTPGLPYSADEIERGME